MSRKNLNLKSTIFKIFIFYITIYFIALFLRYSNGFENLILEINQMRQDLYSVPQINEGHMLNVIMSELLISFKR